MSLINQALSANKSSKIIIDIFNKINTINNYNIRNFHSSSLIQKHHEELEFKIYRWVIYN